MFIKSRVNIYQFDLNLEKDCCHLLEKEFSSGRNNLDHTYYKIYFFKNALVRSLKRKKYIKLSLESIIFQVRNGIFCKSFFALRGRGGSAK